MNEGGGKEGDMDRRKEPEGLKYYCASGDGRTLSHLAQGYILEHYD
jgi:hypothetical protein